jgi:hypothetical protein
MTKKSVYRSLVIMSCVLAPLGRFASAEAVKVQGQIKSRSGATMVLHTTTSPSFTVILTDSTQVGQKKGAFKARRKHGVPGLRCASGEERDWTRRAYGTREEVPA